MSEYCDKHAAHSQALENDKERLEGFERWKNGTDKNVERISTMLDNIERRLMLVEQENRVQNAKPAQKLDELVKYVVFAIVGACLAMILKEVGL